MESSFQGREGHVVCWIQIFIFFVFGSVMEGWKEGKGREGKGGEGGKEGSIFSTPLGCQLVLLAVASVLNTDNLCYRI